MNQHITLVECPRDAMQGWPKHIATDDKVRYINQLLQVGFHTLDCVSFVSPVAIPQMADSAEVLNKIDISQTNTKLLAIVANLRGASEAVKFSSISYLGFPFSISETFQQLNTNSSIAQSWERVLQIQEICNKYNKELVIYLSMGFGNPYGDIYNSEVIQFWIEKMYSIGVTTISLADTVGLATPEQVYVTTHAAIQQCAQLPVAIGVHLHSTSLDITNKLAAAYKAGCIRYDGALKGIGGCPMAKNDLVGNMDTIQMVEWFKHNGAGLTLNIKALEDSVHIADQLFV